MNIQERATFLQKVMLDDRAKVAVYKICAMDPSWFVNHFAWTYDPRLEQATIPFTLYKFQEELIYELKRSLENKDPLVIVKSRDMGLSWTICAFFVWAALFRDGFAGTIASRKQQELDDSTIQSLFGRISFILDKLPSFLCRGYDPQKNRIHMRIELPGTGSLLRGEIGDNIGRGGRSTMLFLDEFAFVPRSATVMEAASQNTDSLVMGSTPCGRGNEFSRIYHDGNVRSLTYKWSLHPKKDDDWYAKKKEIMTEEQIAQELDCSFAKSQKGRVYPQFDYETHTRDNLFDKDILIEMGWDFGINDPTAIVFFQRTPTELRIIDYMEITNTTVDNVMSKILAKYSLQSKQKDRGVVSLVAFGDPDGAKRDRLSGHSVFSHLRSKHNIVFRTKRELVANGILSVRFMLEKNKLVVDKKLRHFIDCFENYKFPEREQGENEKPLHDWTSHAMDAMRYFIDFNYPINQPREATTQRIR
jgi:hypothetical protein